MTISVLNYLVPTAMVAAFVLPLIPLNRIGNPEDVASVVDFLCSEEHMYIHGQVIGINGGMAT